MEYRILTDEQLLHSYNQAKKLNLDKGFINLLRKEIALRGLSINPKPPLTLKESGGSCYYITYYHLCCIKERVLWFTFPTNVPFSGATTNSLVSNDYTFLMHSHVFPIKLLFWDEA